MRSIIDSLKILIVFSILLGIIYPLAIAGFAGVVFPEQAHGSLVTKDGVVVGSSLLGQAFIKKEYFHPRPSAVDYNAAGSGASNLGPSSRKLMDIVSSRIKNAREENDIDTATPVPADMVLASASGLDPDISLQNALLQVKRVSAARGLGEEEVAGLIRKNMDGDFIGVWGMSGVNVLKLNLALDDLRR